MNLMNKGDVTMGREFDQLFDNWAPSYDKTVSGYDEEYKEVFRRYDEILNQVASKAKGTVLEFGIGTGNLTEKLLQKGLQVIGIEPSKEMRTIAKRKLNFEALDGDFLTFNLPTTPINSIVSTYAFHHLTDEEKRKAVQLYSSILSKHGEIIIADTIFTNELEQEKMILFALNNGHDRLANDLKTEYYTTIPILTSIFKDNGFDVCFKQMNDFVWIVHAKKINV